MADLLTKLQAALTSHYTIERELGRGGMAYVFLVQDVKHRRPVAMKVLRPEVAAVVGAERFPALRLRRGGGFFVLRHALRGGGVAPGSVAA